MQLRKGYGTKVLCDSAGEVISMKILHINTFDIGGAATACRRIHLGLLEQGVDSKILLLHKTKNIPETYSFSSWLDSSSTGKKKRPPRLQWLLQKVSRKFTKHQRKKAEIRAADLERRKQGAEIFTFPNNEYDVTMHPLYQDADIIQLNWVSGFLDEPSFFAKNTKPVIWRMADLYACGGGYHYEKNFPFKALQPELNENLAIREEALEGKKLCLVPISDWVRQKACESTLLKDLPKKVIHNGVDLRVFRRHDKRFCREVFDLPSEGQILLFGSQVVKSKRKGFELLLSALGKINRNVQLVVFGDVPDLSEFNLRQPIHAVGTVSDERMLSVLYSAADYFIMPSIEEAFGQVTIEALASGTPVISFPNGGSLDIILNGRNGFLATDFTSVALADAIGHALDTDFDSEAIAEDVRSRFDIRDKVDSYLTLYECILANNYPPDGCDGN